MNQKPSPELIAWLQAQLSDPQFEIRDLKFEWRGDLEHDRCAELLSGNEWAHWKYTGRETLTISLVRYRRGPAE